MADHNFNIVPVNALNKWLNTDVGFVKINKPFTNHNDSYECAAWWEDTEIKTGVYQLKLIKNQFAPNHVQLVAAYDAVVVDDFFPALWGGVRISKEAYKPKNVGQLRKIHRSYDLVSCIEKTGYSPNASDMDFFVNLDLIPNIIEDARMNLESLKEGLDNTFSSYHKEGDGEYHTNISMISHYARNINDIAKAIEILNRKLDGHNKSTEYSKNLYKANTSWAVSPN